MSGFNFPRNRQAGVGLIEVMVAVLVLAIGVLGVAALQAITLKNSGSSAARTQAAIQAYAMMDIARAGRDNLGNFNSNTWAEGEADGDGDPGTFEGWLDDLKTTVAPDAKGLVLCNASTMVCTVGVQWGDSRATGGEEDPISFEITSQL